MKLNATFKSCLGSLLVLAGVLLGLALSAGVTWAESEAVLYSSYQGDRNLNVKCPLMLAPDESGIITAKITNLIDEEITPTVSAEISHPGMPRRVEQIVALGPNSFETLEWSVDDNDIVYTYLILVNILQLRYRNNPSMHGSCGILVWSVFGLPGTASFSLMMAASLAAMLTGAVLWIQSHQPWDHRSLSLGHAGATLLVITVLALLSTFPHWWGLTLILDALILLVLGIIFTEFIMVSSNKVT
jgi:hypothetical protein